MHKRWRLIKRIIQNVFVYFQIIGAIYVHESEAVLKKIAIAKAVKAKVALAPHAIAKVAVAKEVIAKKKIAGAKIFAAVSNGIDCYCFIMSIRLFLILVTQTTLYSKL